MRVKDTFHFSRGQVKKKSRSSSFLCLSLLRNDKETVATQAKRLFKICFLVYAFLVCSSSQTLTLYIARSGAISTSRRSYQIRHSVPVCFIECIWKLSRGEAFAVLICPLPPRGIWQLTWPLPWAFAFQGSKRGRGRGEGEKCEREKGPSLPNSSHKKTLTNKLQSLKSVLYVLILLGYC